jgi:lauroyl/myristoyl acyltransferase
VKFITAKDFYLLSAVGLVQTANWFSSRRLTVFLVQAVAFLAYHLSRTKRRLSETNLSNAFGGSLSKRRIGGIVKSSFRQF